MISVCQMCGGKNQDEGERLMFGYVGSQKVKLCRTCVEKHGQAEGWIGLK